MKQTLRRTLAPALALACWAAPTTEIFAQCPQIEAIMIDACGTEHLNEFVIIHSGGGFNTADIELDYDVNNNIVVPANNDINTDNDNLPGPPCGLTTGNIGAYTGCPNLIAVGPGVNIPANAIVVLQTSAGSSSGLYNFAALCGAGECVYVISSSCVRTAGAFTNGPASGSRTTNFSIAGGCNQSITYNLASTSGGNGAYFLPLSGTYGNAGCVVPPTSPAPLPPNINPIANVTTCGSYTLPTITGTNLTPNVAYFTGPNGTGTQYAPGDVITSTTTLYAFDSNGPGCSDQEQFTVTISPAPAANQPNNATFCASQNANIPLTGTPGATFNWTNDNTAIGLGASGSGNIVFTTANVSSQQTATITITPTLGGCPGTPVSFTITVNPRPIVNNPGNQSACAGSNVSVSFTSPSGNPTYNWTNSTPGIGLPASGSGNINFTAANPANPLTGTITVTPVENGCTGTPISFTITINPAPSITPIANQTACGGQTLNINFTGSSGATFSWANNNTAIGLGASGNGNISFTTANVPTQEVGTITVTPTSPAGCPGNPATFTITVNPGPTMNNPGDLSACAGSPVSVAFSSPSGNPTYAWTNNNTAIGLGASGNGNLNFTAANPANPVTGTITVTPTLGGCPGTPVSFTITVNPAPTVTNPGTQIACAGQTVNVSFSSPSGNPTYNWTNSNTAIGLGANGSGNISFTAAGVPSPTTGVIVVTPSLNGCNGPTQTFNITVNPAPTVNPPANVNACAGQPVSVNFTGTAGATFAWTNSNTAIGLGASGNGNLNFTAANPAAPETGTITVTPTLAGCPGTPATFTITVNPAPIMDDPANQTVCGGESVSVSFTSPSGNPTYNWTNNNPAIGLPASGSGNISFTAANPANPVTATVTVTPSLGGCTGTAQTFTITVNPVPSVNAPANQTACAGQTVTTTFSGSPGATLNWTNSNPAIGLPASGSGNLNFTAANVTAPETATVTVTPSANGCTGTAQTFTITVNPAPVVDNPGNQTACAGSTVTVSFTSPSGNPTYNWTNSNPGIGLPASGSGNLSFTAAGVSNPTTATITVTPTQSGCTGTAQTFTITINPAATVNQPANLSGCGGQTLSANFTGSSGATFAWTNSNTAIGLGASGDGNISFVAAGVSAPEVGTITVTPTSPAGCPGTPVSFTITINPGPTMNNPGDQTACAGAAVNVAFSSPSGNPTYAWTNDNPAIGLGPNGNGNLAFTAANVTNTTTGTITVTPTLAGCAGAPQTFTITVNPNPATNPVSNQTACSSETITVSFTSPSGNPTFNWTNSNTAIGLGASGSGDLNFTAAVVPSATTATITVTASANGCTGAPQSFTITVNPTPVANQPGNVTACSGQSLGVTFTGTPGTTYNWVNDNPAIGLGANGSGNINFPAANVNSPETGTITVTPTLAGCTGTPVSFTITINPGPVVDDPADQSVCGGETVTVTFTSPSGNPNYNWTNNNPAIGLPASGSGNISFTAANPANPITATLTVTPSLVGCVGAAQTFSITVNPLPTVTPPANQTACAGQFVVANFSGTPGATFNWTNSNPAIGLPASGTGNLNFTAAGVPAPTVATITVTPVIGGCTGTPATFTVTVNPGPEMDPVADVFACGGTPINVVFTSPSGNPTYSWTNSNTAIGLGPAGTGNISFTAASPATSQTGVITVTPSENGCVGTPITFSITISPAPAMGQPANATACGGSTVAVAFAGTPGAVFEWTNDNPAIGLPASGTGNLSFPSANPATQQVATIVVTPVLNGCAGPSRTFTITINPTPVMDVPANVAVCGGDFVDVVFTSSNGNPVYNWVNNNPAIGLPASGTGNLSFPSAIVATPQTATITVTPVQGNCTGQPRTFTVVVSPAPTVAQPANLSLCGGQSQSVTLNGSPGATLTWTNNNPATGIPASGSGSTININAANVPVAQTSTITVTPSVGSCTGPAVAFTVTVNPAPTMDDPADQTVCAGTVVSLNFTGPGTPTYSWTNNNPAVGLPANGTGNFSFIAANVAATETATVTVTPDAGACPGIPQTFTITVNPAPAVAQPANIQVCGGEPVVLNFVTSPGTTVSWTNSNLAIGLPASGTGDLDFLAAPVTANELATITLTPDVASGSACAGTPVTFSILVKPNASLDNPGDRTACAGELVDILFSNPNVTWTNDNPNIGLPTNGAGDISFTTANVAGVETATITATVFAAGGFAYIANHASNTVSVVDLTTNMVVATIPVGIQPYGVSVSPDGHSIYVTNFGTSGNGSVTVLDGATNTVVATVALPASPEGIVVAPNGSQVYVVGSTNLFILDATTNTLITTVPLSVLMSGVAVSPDGSRVYLSGSNRVLVLDAATNTIIADVPVGPVPFGICVSPDGSRIYVAISVSDALAVLDAATNTVISTVPVGDSPSGVVVSPDGSTVYVANENGGTVSVVSTATNTVVATVPLNLSPLPGPIGISITPDGQFVYVANTWDNEVSVIETVTNTTIAAIPVGISPVSFGNFITPVVPCAGTPQTFTITVSPAPAVDQPADVNACSGEPVLVPFTGSPGATFTWTNDNPAIGLPASGTGNLDFIAAPVTANELATITVTPDVAGGSACAGASVTFSILVKPISSVDNPGDQVVCSGEMLSVDFNPVGNPIVYWTNSNPAIGLPASGTGDISFTAATVTAPETGIITFSQPGGYAYVPNYLGGDVSVIDLATNTVVATVPVGFGPYGVSVSPNGSRVYITNEAAGTVSVLDGNTNTVVATVPVGDAPSGVAVSPDGSLVYVANTGSNTISAIETAGNTVVATIPAGMAPRGITWHPNGNQAYATGSNPNLLATIDVGSNAIVSSTPVGNTPAGVRVSPNGARIYVANSFDNNVHVLNAANNTLIAIVPTDNFPNGIAISPDGSRVYVTNENASSVTVINAANFTTTAIPVSSGPLSGPIGISITPDGNYLYVVNILTEEVSVIETATNTEVALIPVGASPTAFGNFITPVAPCAEPPQTFTITVNPAPAVDQPADVEACGGDGIAVSFTGSLGATFTWTNSNPAIGLPASGTGDLNFTAALVTAEQTATITVTPDAAGGACPGAPATFEITVKPGLGVDNPGNRAACVGDLVEVLFSTIGNPSTISWTNDNPAIGLPASGTGDISFIAANVTGAETATITVGAEATGDCVAPPQTFTITVGPAPVLAQPDDANLCGNTNTTLAFNASPGAVVSWTNDNPAIGLPASGTGNLVFTAANVATTQTATITATPVLGSCSGAPMTFTVTVNPAVMGGISGDLLLCTGESTTLTASGGGTYEWDNGETTPAITVSPAAPTTYAVLITNSAGCAAAFSAFVNVVPAPTAAISGNTNLCDDETTVLTASGGSAYLWSSSESSASIAIGAAAAGTYTVTVTNISGCTATADVTVIAHASETVIIDQSTCNPADTGTTVVVLQNQFGCDSITITTILLLPNDVVNLTVATCDPAQAGVFTQNLFNQFGCDSTVTTTVLFDPAAVDSVSIALTSCDPAQVGVVTQNLTNQFGCDSVVITTTTLLPTDVVNLTATTCDPSAAGVFTQNLFNQFGCDSTVTTTVLFDPAAVDSVSIALTSCDPAQVGVVTQNLTNQFGCDSVVITTTTLLPTDVVNLTATTCDPDAAGVFIQSLVNQFGCDSTVITTTTLLPTDVVNLTATTCDPDAAGVFIQSLVNQFGCDSTVTTTVLFDPATVDTTSIALTTCDPAQVGVVTQNLTNQFGCDSVVVTTTTLLPSNTVNLTATTCDPAQVGVVTQNLVNQFGCDSVVVTTTTLLPSNTVNLTATTCDPAQVGVVTQNLTNQFGCDSVVVTTTTLLPSNTVNLTATTCDPAQVGVVTQNLTNQFGCDSVVVTTTTLATSGCAPVVAVSTTNPLCAGAATGSFTLLVQGGQPPLAYNWANNLGNTGSGQITALNPPTVVGNLPAGTYSITVTDLGNGASTTATATLTAPPALSTSAAATTAFGGYEVRCAGGSDGSAAATASGGTPPYLFGWSNGTAGSNATALAAGTYTVLATDANGCTVSAMVALSAPPPLDFALQLDRADCADTLVDATVTASGGVAPYLVFVDGNLAGSTMPSLSPGLHLVSVADANGCTADSTVTVTLPPLPTISLPPDTAVVLGNAVRIEAVTNLSAWGSLVWNPLPDPNCPDCLVQEWTPDRPQRISVTITDLAGCTATATILVGVRKEVELYVPNVFRPSSNDNDVWRVSAGKSVQLLREVAVFDRWGNLLYQWNTPTPPNEWPGWDGTTRGQKAGPGVYVYYLKVTLADGTEEVVAGDVTVLE